MPLLFRRLLRAPRPYLRYQRWKMWQKAVGQSARESKEMPVEEALHRSLTLMKEQPPLIKALLRMDSDPGFLKQYRRRSAAIMHETHAAADDSLRLLVQSVDSKRGTCVQQLFPRSIDKIAAELSR
jgi:hypothetical protein